MKGNGQVRAIIDSTSNTAAIADGSTLYTCTVQIASNASAGVYSLIGSHEVVTATTVKLRAAILNGSITVPSAGGGGGC